MQEIARRSMQRRNSLAISGKFAEYNYLKKPKFAGLIWPQHLDVRRIVLRVFKDPILIPSRPHPFN
jgi:hypothetical protein